MNQLDLAVHETAHGFPGGLAAAAGALGTSYGVLKNKVNPSVDTNVLSLKEAMRLMLLSGDCRILEAMARELGRSVAVREQNAGGVLRELLAEQQAHGNLAKLVADVIADNRVSPREAFAVAGEVEAEIASLQRLSDSVKRAADSAVSLFREAGHG
jgi:hypothetical protein